MKTKEFFERRLHAPLANHLNSWGSVDVTNKRVFLRVHIGLLKPNSESPKQATIMKIKGWKGPSPGYAERLKHIELLKHDGYAGFAVSYSDFWDGYKWRTKDFEQRFLFQLGKITTKVTDEDTLIVASVTKRIPVDAVVGCSANKQEEAELDKAVSSNSSVTECQALVKARVGQGQFRDDVLELWSYQCAVTGSTVTEAIRASHIKAWSESNDDERRDKYNGLPLIATLDALFDKHLISFDARGKMIVSEHLPDEERRLLLPKQRRLRVKPSAQTAKLLKEHAAQLR